MLHHPYHRFAPEAPLEGNEPWDEKDQEQAQRLLVLE